MSQGHGFGKIQAPHNCPSESTVKISVATTPHTDKEMSLSFQRNHEYGSLFT